MANKRVKLKEYVFGQEENEKKEPEQDFRDIVLETLHEKIELWTAAMQGKTLNNVRIEHSGHEIKLSSEVKTNPSLIEKFGIELSNRESDLRFTVNAKAYKIPENMKNECELYVEIMIPSFGALLLSKRLESDDYHSGVVVFDSTVNADNLEEMLDHVFDSLTKEFHKLIGLVFNDPNSFLDKGMDISLKEILFESENSILESWSEIADDIFAQVTLKDESIVPLGDVRTNFGKSIFNKTFDIDGDSTKKIKIYLTFLSKNKIEIDVVPQYFYAKIKTKEAVGDSTEELMANTVDALVSQIKIAKNIFILRNEKIDFQQEVYENYEDAFLRAGFRDVYETLKLTKSSDESKGVIKFTAVENEDAEEPIKFTITIEGKVVSISASRGNYDAQLTNRFADFEYDAYKALIDGANIIMKDLVEGDGDY